MPIRHTPRECVAFKDLGRIPRKRQRMIIGIERFIEEAQMGIGEAEIVPGPRKGGIEPDCFLVEDDALIRAAVFGKHCRERIPKDRLGRHPVKRGTERFDGNGLPALVAWIVPRLL
jgi:hypothetical protein